MGSNHVITPEDKQFNLYVLFLFIFEHFYTTKLQQSSSEFEAYPHPPSPHLAQRSCSSGANQNFIFLVDKYVSVF